MGTLEINYTKSRKLICLWHTCYQTSVGCCVVDVCLGGTYVYVRKCGVCVCVCVRVCVCLCVCVCVISAWANDMMHHWTKHWVCVSILPSTLPPSHFLNSLMHLHIQVSA